MIAGGGATLLPGLHDHHVHLLAMAAVLDSVNVSALADAFALGAAIRAAPGPEVRVVGYHDSIAGPLDRKVLDGFELERPVRVQHRSGGLWILNSAALRRLFEAGIDAPGCERGPDGAATGRLWRADQAVRSAFPGRAPDLRVVGDMLSRHGITGVTDATPDPGSSALEILHDAHAAGALPQRITTLGGHDSLCPAGLLSGPRKILLHDHDLPSASRLTDMVRSARVEGRAVAVHCVTADALALTLGVLSTMGAVRGDRIEHAAVVPPGLVPVIAGLGLHVVTQPDFLRTRGDDYLRDVPEAERPWLYPFASLRDAGIVVVASSDAPFGESDPWRVMRTASSRTTRGGTVIASDERVSPRNALAGYLTAPGALDRGPRTIHTGMTAVLCLLRGPLEDILTDWTDEPVRMTMIGGAIAYLRDQSLEGSGFASLSTRAV